jgi:acetolactate synthase-1/2/3 large subunit
MAKPMLLFAFFLTPHLPLMMMMTLLSADHPAASPAAPYNPAYNQPAELNGAQMLIRALVMEGVDTVFGYPGGVILPIYEALPDYPELQHLLVRHEQGACHMAEGYARTTGKAGVVLVTSGPGATNIVTGVADAYYDSTPMVVITGNVPSNLLGADAFQEADILGITRPCTKHNLIVRRIEDLVPAIREAFHVATTGRQGPVVVDIPKDIINAKGLFDHAASAVNLPGYDQSETATTEDLQTALAHLAAAKQPVILAGGGVMGSGAYAPLRAFAERFNIPVGLSLMGLGSFPTQHPLCMGFTGMHGHYWANLAIANADVLLVVGNRLNDRQTGKADRFARKAKIIHLDLDPINLNKNVEATLPLQGDIGRLLEGMLALSDTPEAMAAHTESLASRQAWFDQIQFWKERRTLTPTSTQHLSPQHAIETVFKHLPKENVYVTTEVGQHQMWAAQRYNLDQPRSWVTSGGLGTMGFGFPAAIGIQAAFPTATVVDIAGDGSFQMTLQELATAVQYKLPVKVAIINNSYLGMIRQWQGKMYGRESEAEMLSPDYVKLAEAYGAAGFRATTPQELEALLPQALAIMDRPVLIDIKVSEQVDVYPWVPSGSGNEDMLTEQQPPSST